MGQYPYQPAYMGCKADLIGLNAVYDLQMILHKCRRGGCTCERRKRLWIFFFFFSCLK